jgi:GNAT superfamily N-acetyltransferase
MTDSTTTALGIEPLVIPASLDAPDAGPFLALIRLANAVCLNDTGHDYLHEEPAEVLGMWQDQSDWEKLGFVAARDGEIIGAVKIMISTEDATVLEYDLMVDPDRWGEGAEEALLAEVEREARARRLSTIQTWTLHRPDTPGERLDSPTGWGSIPAGDRQTQLQLRHGFRLEQVERNSVFDLAGDLSVVERMLADARRHAGDEYRVVTWTSPTPDEYKDGLALVMARMSTDAPSAGMDVDEQRWDAARIERRDARQKAQGQTAAVAAVQHVPTGTIAAYNELVIGEDHRAATHQYGTLVLKEHRGRRLGTIVKCANLLRWREIVPESPRVSTFNAEENRYMLDINETIGFRAASYAGAWQKVLTD